MTSAVRPAWFDFNAPDYPRLFQERIDRLKRIRAQPDCLPLLKAFYRDNPAHFLQDWGITHDPRNLERGMPALVAHWISSRIGPGMESPRRRRSISSEALKTYVLPNA